MATQGDSSYEGWGESSNHWEIEPIRQPLILMQHYLIRLRHLIDLKARYKTDPGLEPWRMGMINKAIHATVKSLKF